ncbi:MAG: alpha/beta fold hydrolase [Halieaceae bacterium]|jgi:uncharacterized protein|nr:alpha/beta fold hydrolase [Halieaceae bacterium]
MGYKRLDRDFSNDGLRCAAWLYLPDEVQRPPVVIMAHGFAGERTFCLPAFAEKFVDQGLAVVLFDYRNFGDSAGEPRNWVDPDRHRSDWKAALAHVRSLPEVDSSRIALWGSSFSGGHVICTAAEDGDIRAIVAQVPYVGGATDAKPSPGFVLKVLWALLLDKLKTAITGQPHWIPAIARPGEFGIMTAAEAQDYWTLLPPGSTWQNRVPARILSKVSSYRPVDLADGVNCPALLVLGEQDETTPPAPIRACFDKLPLGELMSLDCGHFAVYSGPMFEQVVAREAAFLTEHLGA